MAGAAEVVVGAAAGAVVGVASAAGTLGSGVILGAGIGVAAAAAVAGVGVGVGLGTAAGIIFDHFEMSQNDQVNVGTGVYLGSVAAGLIDGESDVLPTFITISLASGIFSGIATLLRR